MKKSRQICVVCEKTRGKRSCRLRADALICPTCCAEIRDPDKCGDCEHFVRAAAYEDRKHVKSGGKHFIIEMNPEVEEAVDQALVLLEKGNIEEAESRLRSLLLEHPRHHQVHYGMGLVHAMRKEYDEAQVFFDMAVEIFPYFVEAWVNKATTHIQKIEVWQAIEAHQRVVELDSARGDGSFAKRSREFLEDVRKTVCKELGLSLHGYVKAMRMYDEAFALIKEERYGEAKRGFLRVLALSDKHFQSWGNLGLCYAFLGDKQKSLEALDKALALNPEYGPALQNKALIEKLAEGEKPQGPMKTVFGDLDADKRTLD